MEVKIQKWGNSQGVRLPKAILDKLKLAAGDSILLETAKGEIHLKPVPRRDPAITLEGLVRRIPRNHKRQAVDWGRSVGREVW